MILAKGSHSNGDSLVMGLSAGNLKRLKKGQPIHFLLADRIGALAAESLTNPTITIVYGTTEQAIFDQFKKAGMLHGTEILPIRGDGTPTQETKQMNEAQIQQTHEPVPIFARPPLGSVRPGAERQMPRYKCHKEVWALKIDDIERMPDGSAIITPAEEGFGRFAVDAAWLSRWTDENDYGYYIVYQDGYKSWSPTKAFVEGYTPMTAGTCPHCGKRIDAAPPILEAVQMLNECLEIEDGLSDWEVEFLESLEKQSSDRWTTKQRTKLEQIWQERFGTPTQENQP